MTDTANFTAVQIEIIRQALVAAAEEMSVTVWRTSRSPVVRDILDYSTCIFDAEGRSVAQAARMPVHLNSMASCLHDLLRHSIPIDDWHDGDIIITNDPYSGGQHLPDIQTFAPVFVDGARVAIVGILVHHLDVGGGAPGSYDAGATEIYQEGFRIPPMKLQSRGERNNQVIQLLLANSREPYNVGGDFLSQLAALETGAQSVTRLAQRYGIERLRLACEKIQQQSEYAVRDAIRSLRNGTYHFTDAVDDDGLDDQPLQISVQVTVKDDTLHVAFAGTSQQARGPVNCTLNMTRSAVICGLLMALDQDIPANDGCYRPIHITAEPGTLVHAQLPAPVANRMAVGHRVVNAVMGAMSEARPGKVAAAYYGVSYVYALNMPDKEGRPRVYFDLECGGWGAHPEADGRSAFSCGFHNVANAPVEMLEQRYPVTFLRYGLRDGSGGAGKHQGGMGLERTFRLDSDYGVFAGNFDRFKIPPYGLAGGEPGAPGRLRLWRAPADGPKPALGDLENQEPEYLNSKVVDLPMTKNDVISLETSGGGGYGRAEKGATAD